MNCYDLYNDEETEHDVEECNDFLQALLGAYRCQLLDLVGDNALTHHVVVAQPAAPAPLHDMPPRIPSRRGVAASFDYAEDDCSCSDDDITIDEEVLSTLNPSRWAGCAASSSSPDSKWASEKRDSAPVLKRNSLDNVVTSICCNNSAMPTRSSRPAKATLKDLTYFQVRTALSVWDQARCTLEDFDTQFGMLVLERLFRLEPQTKRVFYGCQGNENAQGKAQAAIHASAFVTLLDTVVHMLEPDVEFVQDVLSKVGRRHEAMGVEAAFFPIMGRALMETFEETTPSLSQEQRFAWVQVYHAVTHELLTSRCRRNSC